MTKQHIKQTIGNNIRNERILRNLSIDELSELSGLSPGYLGLIERGDRGTTAANLFKISKIFEMPIDHFFESERYKTLDNLDELTYGRHKKIESLISDFADYELDFVISIIKNMRTLNRQKTDNDDLDSN